MPHTTCHCEYKKQKCSRYPKITSFISFGQRSLIILNFGLAIKAQAVSNEHKMRMRLSLTVNVNVSGSMNVSVSVSFSTSTRAYSPVQINVSFGLLITLRARAINLISGCLFIPLPDKPHLDCLWSLIYRTLYVIYI